ncbi:MAG: hypothetical protein ACTHNP_11120 [Solirubrobacterales bacterium]
MWRRRKQVPGNLVYLSEAKLYGLAAHLEVRTDRIEPNLQFERTGGGRIGVPPMADLSGKATVKGERVDPGAEERFLLQVLEKVLARLGEMPDLEKQEDILEGELFRFHRNLKFGVGHSDAGPPIKALVVVDAEPIPRDLTTSGLLMNGSIAYVRDPYATDELRETPGSRSGSGTERLFNWLDEARRAWEADPPANMRTILSRTAGPPRGSTDATDMYWLFADEGWLAGHLAEPLMHGAPCEGVARASFIAPGEESLVVMGSPLFIRVAPLQMRKN